MSGAGSRRLRPGFLDEPRLRSSANSGGEAWRSRERPASAEERRTGELLPVVPDERPREVVAAAAERRPEAIGPDALVRRTDPRDPRRYSTDHREVVVPEQVLHALEDYERAIAAPRLLLFKHSPVCPVSAAALAEYRAFVAAEPAATTAFVDVIADRPTARGLAERCGVGHESPQAILFANGRPVWHTSHAAITLAALVAAWRAAAPTRRIHINGELRELAVTTVADLVAALGCKPAQVAVERNQVLVRRADHASTPVADGDRFEVVTFFGGG
ncbi:MAG: bacillithiol system redox-active protein YtxJ [Planctomycetes bacterium]|nr:bacillithiol system redox-active protein YtxJ [Planctomycetota bacterium]